MAIPITYTNTDPQKFVSSASRYTKQKVILYSEQNKTAFDTYKRTITPFDKKDKYTTITPAYEYRPDLLAYDFYSLPDLWWKIMEANGIYDVYDFKKGLNIRLPHEGF